MIRPDLEAIPPYVPGVRDERAIKLSSNECAEGPLPPVLDAMSNTLGEINRYPDIGALRLRTALGQHLGVEPEQVALGAGSSALCQQLVSIAAQPGDEVVFPWRSFEAYPIFVQIVGATPVKVPLDSDNRLDMPALAAAVTERTKLIFLCNPNNPTGTTITNAEFTAFMDKVPADVLVVLDEAYFEYNQAADTPVATEVITRYPNVVGLRTFSKAYGLAGARIGYAFGPRPIIDALNKVSIPFSVSAIAQEAALASLEAQEALRARIDGTVAERSRVVAKLGLAASQANFVWLPGAGKELADRLAAEGVLVRSFPEGIRVTVTNTEETDALLEAFDRAQ
ncbi:histidinol-phosphate transaminase [Corynebacterium sp. HMSC034A01]|uniref:histidinol-phosphate transaminase n=1 Tax=Corynebacterium sp. HMSC034A01 TaxID=1739295 RepID=UPI0008A98920|nr:histidinol-phosphate transaminase [Corynebacterium sp. HMSC034A01]OHR20907.1 aminotransferase [Corynebacterium sp. HMSC034A01]